MGFPHSSVGKESACNTGGLGLIPGLGRSTREGIGYPFQYSWASLVAQLLKNPQCGRPGFDPWVGKIPWSRERLPTPVFWPGEFHGLYSPWDHKESDTNGRLSLSFCWSIVSSMKAYFQRKVWVDYKVFECLHVWSSLSFHLLILYRIVEWNNPLPPVPPNVRNIALLPSNVQCCCWEA